MRLVKAAFTPGIEALPAFRLPEKLGFGVIAAPLIFNAKYDGGQLSGAEGLPCSTLNAPLAENVISQHPHRPSDGSDNTTSKLAAGVFRARSLLAAIFKLAVIVCVVRVVETEPIRPVIYDVPLAGPVRIDVQTRV